MGDPLAVKSLTRLLKKYEEIVPRGSNLISVLSVYPQTQKEMRSKIITSRALLDFERSEYLPEDEMPESSDEDTSVSEVTSLIGATGIRHRKH